MDEEAKQLEEGLGPKNTSTTYSSLVISYSNLGADQNNIKVNNKSNDSNDKIAGDVIVDRQNKELEKNPAAMDHHEVKQKNKRVATLDAFRGLTIVLMILVDGGGGAYPCIDHSPWNGCTLADFVMPFFLFIVGVVIALALKKISKINNAVKKIILRTLKLLFWGILLQGGYSHAPDYLSYGVNMKQIRWFGILHRIALVYFVVSLIETLTTKLRPTTIDSGFFSIFTAYRWQWFGGFVAFLVYMVTTFALYVPDWSFVLHSNGEPKQYTDLHAMQLGMLTEKFGVLIIFIPNLFGDASSWCLAPFEPEGLLSSVSAILSGTIGIHYGHVLIHFKGHSERLKQWVSMGFGLLIIGIILHFTDAIPINKQLYSFSYVCFTAKAAGIVFSAFYLLIDVWGFRKIFIFLEWIGMNAMLVFVLGAQGILAAFFNGWYYETPDKSLVHWIEEHVFINVWHSERVGTLLYVIFAEIAFWAVLAGILHKFRIYWKL